MQKNKIKTALKYRENNNIRRFWYILVMVLLGLIYLSGQFVFYWDWFAEVFATIVAIVTIVAFWLEYNENRVLNESQFIISLNEQFVSDERLFKIEWELEKFYIRYEKGELTDEYIESFRKQFDIEDERRQYLVNYLVHLEGIATLVNNGTLRIDKIDDLMSYRYFIAMNNPIVQELELKKYSDYYKGCICIYEDWVKVLTKEGVKIPMYDKYRLIDEGVLR